MLQVLIGTAALCLLISLRRFRQRKMRRGLTMLALTVILLLLSLAYYRIDLNISGYDLILDERDIVEVKIDAEGRVRIQDLVNRRTYTWQAKGNAWHLVLRELRLTGRCAFLGWPSVYRLSSIEAIEVAEKGQKSILHDVELHHSSRGTDLWRQIRRLQRARPHLEPQIRQCVLADKTVSDRFDFSPGSYRFSFVNDRLQVRQVNAAGR